MAENENVQKIDDNAVEEAIAAARSHHQETAGASGAAAESSAAESRPALTDNGQMEIAAQCVSVTVADRKICLNLPLKIGRVCLPVPPFVPNGKVAQACVSICTKFGIPTGVRLTVSVGGQVIIRKTFGVC